MTHRVSVVIPTFNRARYIQRSLESILQQTRPPDEVVVVDDGSEDSTQAVLEPYSDRVTVIRKQNGGKSSALNLAIPRTSGNLVWVFDDDDIAFPDALERHLAVHERHPDIGFSYSPAVMLHTDEQGRETRGRVVPIPDVHDKGIFYVLQHGCAINQQGTVVRRTRFESVGFFKEDLHRTQDYDFLLRMARRYEGVGLESPTFFFRQHLGLRGSATARHDPTERGAKFFAYERLIWRELLPELEWYELLPDSLRNATRNAILERETRIRRMMIAARFGLPEMFLDLLRGMGNMAERSRPLNARERRSAWLAFSRPEGAVFAVEQPAFVDEVTALLKEGAMSELALHFLRGAGSAARHLRADGRTREARRVMTLCRQMLAAGAWRDIPGHMLERSLYAFGVSTRGGVWVGPRASSS